MHSNKLCSSAGYQLAFHTLDHRKARSICRAARFALFGCQSCRLPCKARPKTNIYLLAGGHQTACRLGVLHS